jgi:cobalt-precorrin-5B (C1)-methyltransferase
VADHIGFALDRAAAAGFRKAVLVGHLGKIVKVAAGLFNTHSRYGDAAWRR